MSTTQNQAAPMATSQPQASNTAEALPVNQPAQQPTMAAQSTQPPVMALAQPQVVQAAQPVMYVQPGPQLQQPFQQVPQAQPVMYAQGPQLQQPFQQVPQAQPVQFVQQAPYHQQPLVSGGVAYTAQPQPGAPQLVMNPGHFNQPDFNYTPNNYFLLTLIMGIICGIFSPLSLACSIPAVIFSVKSKNSSKVGRIKQAKREGLYAVYLLIAAILFALIVATIFTGVMIPLHRSLCIYSYECDYYYYG